METTGLFVGGSTTEDGKYRLCLNCMEYYDSSETVCKHCGCTNDSVISEPLYLKPGSVLAGRYIVGRILGHGSFTATYLAFDEKLKRKIAIKEYFPNTMGATRKLDEDNVIIPDDEKVRRRFIEGKQKFLEEGRILSQLENEDGIVHVYDSFEENNTSYISMEYLDGETLQSFLDRPENLGKKWTQKEVLDLMIPVMNATSKVHEKGVFHRAICPENIFVVKDSIGALKAKLVDFGSIRFLSGSHSKSLTVVIHPGYSAEEQYHGDGVHGTYTDVYALGAVIYRLVTGSRPTDAFERWGQIQNGSRDTLKDPGDINKGLSDNFETAVLNALNAKIEDRTQTVEQFMEELVSVKKVKRKGSTIKKIDFMKWPLWAKVSVPVASIAAIALVIWAAFRLINAGQTEYTLPDNMTRMPDFVSADLDEAAQWAEEASVELQRVGSRYQPGVTTEVVLTQELPAGKVMEKNTLVNLMVSVGEEDFLMPDLLGYDLEYAQKALECMNMQVEVNEDNYPEIKKGCVVKQDVKPYSEIKTGDIITLTVSSGAKQAEGGVVPDFVGMTYEDAAEAAKEAGVTICAKEKVFSDISKESKITAQSIESEEEISGSQVVDLNVAMDEREFPMPSLMYKEKETVDQLMENIGVQTNYSKANNEVIAAGLVAEQSVESETQVKPGSKVDLVISEGSKPFEMPKVIGLEETKAQQVLTESKLAVTLEYGYEEGVEEGSVISQSVDPGKDITRGSKITITVCTTEGLEKVIDVTGMSLAEARQALKALGFKVREVGVYSDTYADGRIIDCPTAGTMQKKGTEIIINVSRGRDPKSVKREEENKKLEEQRQQEAEDKAEENRQRQEQEDREAETKRQEEAAAKKAEEEAAAKKAEEEAAAKKADEEAAKKKAEEEAAAKKKAEEEAAKKKAEEEEAARRAATKTQYRSREAIYGDWSEWSFDEYISDNLSEVEQKTVYRHQDYELTGYSTSYGNWSGWQDGVITADSTRDVDTQRVESRRYYYHWCIDEPDYPYSSDAVNFDDRCAYHELSDTSHLKQVGDHYENLRDDGSHIWCSNRCYKYYLGIDYKTQYRYRSINKNPVYEWSGWSDWGDEAIEGTDNRRVETGTMYRKRSRDLNNWSDWSEWSDTPIEASDSVQVETREVPQ